MSFKSREKKRKSRIAASSAKANRRQHPDRWYLTIVTRPCCCNACGGSLREGAECVYRHEPREVLCLACAQRRRIAPRPSLRWERAKRSKQAKRRTEN